MAFRASLKRANRAIVYTQNGEPEQVLRAVTFKPLPSPPPNTLNIKYLLSPINPADINVVQGVYPAKPASTVLNDEAAFVGGNEGLAEVLHCGSGASGFSEGDWVVMTKPQSGTWRSTSNVSVSDVLKLPRAVGLTEAHGATMTVNPPTAWNMLADFVKLQEGDWVLQNGANSAVGQAVIQIAAARGLKTLNLVRNRPNLESLAQSLKQLGATEVLSYDDLADRQLTERVMKNWTGGRGFKLGLNCVGGKDTTAMTRLLGHDAFLVSYGAMSKQPLALPTSAFIFKNLTCTGFWQSRWYKNHTKEETEMVMTSLVDLVSSGKLNAPEHEILVVSAQDTDEVAGQKVRDAMAKLSSGQYGKKVLLKIEGAE